MRTIHGVGEMMTQMVLSRGSIFPVSVPDAQPIVHPSKQASPGEQEDVTVMDTKLKVIEILQVCPALFSVTVCVCMSVYLYMCVHTCVYMSLCNLWLASCLSFLSAENPGVRHDTWFCCVTMLKCYRCDMILNCHWSLFILEGCCLYFIITFR